MTEPIRMLILTGSPRVGGVSEQVGGRMARHAEEAGAVVETVYLSETAIDPCTGCGGCYDSGICIIPDAMHGLLDSFDAADVVAIVTPVYFASVPAQLKAVLDRFESRWAVRYLLGREPERRRSGLLAVVGTGEDPYGYDPAITVVKSALSTIRVRIDDVLDLIGYLQPGDGISEEDGARAIDDAVDALLARASEDR